MEKGKINFFREIDITKLKFKSWKTQLHISKMNVTHLKISS